MKKIIAIHAIVHGKVQGVFYRHYTREQAHALNLTGWVKNNTDGTVELEACGDEAKIQLLIEWLKQGPPRAEVSKVDWQIIAASNYDGFRIIQ